MQTHLDNFRKVYTLNYNNEKDSQSRLVSNYNFVKIAMWVPVISHIFALVLFMGAHEGLTSKNPSLRTSKSEAVAYISRGIIGCVIPPLLMVIDLVGTFVKIVIDAINLRKNLDKVNPLYGNP